MTFIERLKKIEQIDQLIRLKTTGNMSKFSCKIKLSERQTWRYIDDLKGMGAEIEYSKESDSYVYKNAFNYNLGVGKKELRKIKGGFFYSLTKSGRLIQYI